jgi:hypothetical protein
MCSYIWYRNNENDRPLALWIFVFSLMQLFEFFMWRNMKDHSWASKISLVFILVQPVVLGFGLLSIGKILGQGQEQRQGQGQEKEQSKDDEEENNWRVWIRRALWLFVGIGVIKVVYTIFWLVTTEKNKNWLSEKGEHCHLVWYFTRNEDKMPYLTRINQLYYIPLLFTALSVAPLYKGLIYSVLGAISFNFSRWYYGKEWGSIWCWMANALAFITVIIG